MCLSSSDFYFCGQKRKIDMKRTTNYDLPTWEKDDFIRMQDFNDLTGKLDAALKSGADAQTALQNAIKAVKATAENAYSSANKPYVAGSYTGNGGTQTVDLGFKPRFLVISRGFDKGDYSADYALFAGTPEQIDDWMAKVWCTYSFIRECEYQNYVD